MRGEKVFLATFSFLMLAMLTLQLELGDSCTLKDGSSGTCRPDRNCSFAIDLLKKGKGAELVPCGVFVGTSQVVCCKDKCCEDNAPPRFSSVLRCDGKVENRPPKPVMWENHIVNGQHADVGEFPHLAAIGFKAEDKPEPWFKCGGTLISENFVLTAAHCCNRKNDQPVMVRLGKTSLNDTSDQLDAQDINIKKVISHEKFDSRTKINDIALLQLEKPAKFTYYVWPACLSSEARKMMKNLSVSGFGVKDNADKTSSTWLLKGLVDEVALPFCMKKFSELKLSSLLITPKHVCAHNPITFTDTCQGDSGGPMEYKKNDQAYVYGITSYGIGCGSPDFPSVYTRVDEYLNWIEENMKL